MTRKMPLRRTILHRSHRRTTDAATFIGQKSPCLVLHRLGRGERQFYAHV